MLADSLFICEQIADKMKDPANVVARVEEAIGKNSFLFPVWPAWSFADGLPGISCFYSAMHRILPRQGWNLVADRYLRLALEQLKKYNLKDVSLYNGLTGLSYALYCASRSAPGAYEKLLLDFDDWLNEEVRFAYLNYSATHLDENEPLSPAFYSFVNGLPGIISYLSLRQDSFCLQQLLLELLKLLARVFLGKKKIDGKELAAWYLPKEKMIFEELANLYPEGGFIANMGQGVSGVLFAFTAAAASGVCPKEVFDAMQLLSSWLHAGYAYMPKERYWNHVITKNGDILRLPDNYHMFQFSYLSGWPAMARSLSRAGSVLKDRKLKDFAFELFTSQLPNGCPEMQAGSSFCVGLAGFTSVVGQMACEENSPFLRKLTEEAERQLGNYYRAASLFGFTQPFFNPEGESIIVDVPGVNYGAAGIGLAFLSTTRECCDFVHF